MPPVSRAAPVILLVLDGWGYRAEREGNAIAMATVPTWDRLWARAPRTLLAASGEAVGLPCGQIGNSEVGHLNLGAGRVVKQDLVRISGAIADGSFFTNDVLVDACRRVKANGGTLHLVGLIGTGGVHAIDTHLVALLDLAEREGVPRVAIQVMLDGRDTMPRSGLGYLEAVMDAARGRAVIASVGGRYFGMDRDHRWERTAKWYRAAVEGTAPTASDPLQLVRDAYERGETDEFLIPTTIVGTDGRPLAPMRDGDAVICFNYRSDRMRQIVRTLAQPEFAGFETRSRPKVTVATMTLYDQEFTSFGVQVAFAPQSMARIVGEVLSTAGLTNLRTAETEKYAHVTYFFNGGIETPFPGEERRLVPSQKVATYDLAPEMSAAGITDVLCAAIAAGEHDFMLCNFANADMVGHTGSIPATLRAVETVDASLARIVAAAGRTGARLLVTADHGNCEMMIDPATGGPHTAHTTNPVPFLLVDGEGDHALREGGALCDVGPTILGLLGIEQPSEMTGRDLRVR
ncbi:MAG: 2,3-bisphosphoglycerate-independent phosphoglycerate mutase [Gemmatimonadetes bacterium]|jgi:2,3-bisphosphoglycerate-independent phosphoglycerate mutase|nr:2,3-bisphosphoglycerate-independent phosphoglycerate mutase [Gemmatimonadota bacterium]